MREARRGDVLVPLERLLGAGTCAGLTDGELLERFTTRRGSAAEAAFATLVERHGPAVLRLCRGVLRDRHNAEDAFQATFLVLARRAGSIRRKESVGPWLRGVALRVAGYARSAAARRQRHELAAAGIAPTAYLASEPTDGTVALLEELGRLPEKFRVPLVLCYLEGMAQDDVAARLGWPLGTVRSRLARGRERLRVRLARRGLAPALGAWAAMSAREASAAVPPGLVKAATRAAVGGPGLVSLAITTLTEEVVRAMTWTKLKVIGASVLAVGFTAAGAGVIAQQAGGRPDAPARVAPGPAPSGIPSRAGGPERPADQPADQEAARLAEQVEILKAHIRTLEQGPFVVYPSIESLKARIRDLERGYEENIMTPPERPPAVDALLATQPTAPSAQQRLRRIERMLEELLAERRQADPPAPLGATVPPPPNDEDRPKAAAWERLRRDGLVGRFDAEPVNAVKFLTELYRRYVGRKPTQDEVAMLAKLTGPGHEQWTADPETIIRRLFNSDWFAGTPLGQALLATPGTGPMPGLNPRRQ